jgi:hypothetical protein
LNLVMNIKLKKKGKEFLNNQDTIGFCSKEFINVCKLNKEISSY